MGVKVSTVKSQTLKLHVGLNLVFDSLHSNNAFFKTRHLCIYMQVRRFLYVKVLTVERQTLRIQVFPE